MEGKTVSFNTHCNLYESQLEAIARWLSCNGEVWGMGPTVVFASAAALFLYNELEATVFIAGDHGQVSLLEKTLVSTMVLGMLALMIHLWVCSMRFFQYYLDTLIKDSPSMLLEMTTASFLGKMDIVPLGPLTRFLRQQQPQIHITLCWFLSLCYADYVRKHYCQRFNMPYLEQWQTELQESAVRGVNSTMQRVNSFVGAVHQRLRGYRREPLTTDAHTVERAQCMRHRWRSTTPLAPLPTSGLQHAARGRARCARASSASPATPRRVLLKNSEHTLRKLDVPALVHRTPASVLLAPPGLSLRRIYSDRHPWRMTSDELTSYIHKIDVSAKYRSLHLVMWYSNILTFIRTGSIEIIEWAKCGDSRLSAIPTIVWTIGSAAVAHRLISTVFRRFLFRRVPLWEITLQHLLFLWMVMYSVHLWTVVVHIVKFLVKYCYETGNSLPTIDDLESEKLMQQWMLWMCAVLPLLLYIHIRPKPVAPPLMIWITTNPWQRREMGAYGYYLNRPPASLPSPSASLQKHALVLRRAFSDSSKAVIKESLNLKKRRNSKSV
ncbi:uncharacterized protein LOC120628826 [Pararge aegeria]|uniref:uncharacterized protein LOC120628826 n=1 Tax=Pararge aegeria TaxID=116150 RepID=UPI0019D2D55A|nr:uncharacterized protein LOC120628826 [Pararge aegeria]